MQLRHAGGDFLGSPFGYEKMGIDPKKVEAMQKIGYLEGTRQAKTETRQRFLDMTEFCWRYIPK